MPITRRVNRSLSVSFLMMIVLALTACSVVRLAYNQADHLAYWQLNRAFDFNEEQSVKVKASIRQWFQWHRQTQLPVYVSFLARAEKEALAPVSPALACERRTELEGWGRKAIDQAVPAMADLVLSLTTDQVIHLEKYQAKTNEDFRDDYLEDDVQDRHEAAAKFVLKVAEIFYGRLNDAQRDHVKTEIAALPLNAQNVYEERLMYQRDFVQLIRKLNAQKATPAQAQQALRELFQQFFDPPKEPLRSQRLQWIAAGCKLTSSLHQQTTSEQKAKAAQRLRDWETDLRILNKQPA
ncbi:DUF6279 family lipoprotein [Aquabacterium sp. CECT 9606]|uniref:DUF6279 family lipoprotein n=1 Tax=Aquabacterium sp. CECT 9606 TaxID=2845822 RepID=UPI001E32908C|nr:DUF6279 family lipoprotein [Aquabacterium sp. CECT 9606]CAH0354736.1 hypothetical protein AQB9606_03914 [Aquabacterium sp. CECT 9606]